MAPKGSSSKGKSSRHRSHKHRKNSDSEVEPVRKSKTSSKHRDGETDSKRGHKRRQSGDVSHSSRSSKRSKAEAEKLVVAGPELPSAWNDEQGSHEDVGAHLPAFEAGPAVKVGAQFPDGVASSCDSKSRKEKVSTENRAVTVVNSSDTVQMDDSLLGTHFRLKNNGTSENVPLEGDSKEEVDQTEGICSSRKGNRRLSNVEGHKESEDSETCSPLLRSKERSKKREKMEKQKEKKTDKGQSAGESNEWRIEEEARNLELLELEIPMRPRKEESVDRDRRKRDDRERKYADHREDKKKEVKQREDQSRRDCYDRNADTYYKEGSRSPKTLFKAPESRNKEDMNYDSDRGCRSPNEGSLRKENLDHGRSSYDPEFKGKKSRSKDFFNDDDHRSREKGSKDSHRNDGVHISRQKSSKDERYYRDDGEHRSRQKRSKEDRSYRADEDYQSRQKGSKEYHRDEDEYFRDEDECRSQQKESQQKGSKDERYHRDDDEHRSRQKGDDDERQSRRRGSRDERYHRDEDEHQSRQKTSKDERSYRDEPDNSRSERERRGSSSKPPEDRIKKDRHYDSDRECRSPHDDRSLRKEYPDHGRNSYDPEFREKRSRSKDINDDEYRSRQRGSKERYDDEYRSRHKGSKDERYYRDEDHKQERRKPDDLRNERVRGGSSLSRSSMRSGNTCEDASGRIDRKPGIHRRGEGMSVGAGDAWNWNRSQNNAFSPFPPHFGGMPGGGFPAMRQPFPGPPMFGRAQMELGYVPNRFHGPGNHIGEEGYRSHAYSSWYGPGEVYDGRMDGWDGSGNWERRVWDRDHDSWPRDDYMPHLQMESSHPVNTAEESPWTGPQEAIGSSSKSELNVNPQEAPAESSQPGRDAFLKDTRISKEMRLLLSRLNVSEELAGPEVYAQYLKFMEDEKIEMPTREMPVDIPTESDPDLSLEADSEAEALLKAPDVMDTIFPPLPDSVFEAALKIYRQPAEENRLAKSLVGTFILPFDPSSELCADLLQPEFDPEKGSNKDKAVVAVAEVDSLIAHHLEGESVYSSLAVANSGSGDTIVVTHGKDIETCQNTTEVSKLEGDADRSVKMGDPGELCVDSLKEGNSFCNKLDGAIRDTDMNGDNDLSGRVDKRDELPGSNGIVHHLVVDFVEHSLQDRQLSNELELHQGNDDVNSGASVQKAVEKKEAGDVDEDGAKELETSASASSKPGFSEARKLTSSSCNLRGQYPHLAPTGCRAFLPAAMGF